MTSLTLPLSHYSMRRSSSCDNDKTLYDSDLRVSVSGDIDDLNEVENNATAGDDSFEKGMNSSDSGLQLPLLERDVPSDASFDYQHENHDYCSEPHETDDQLESESESSDFGEEISAEEYYSADPDFDANHCATMLPLHSPQRQRKGRKFMGKIAKSMKAGTSMTGKKVVKQGKRVGKRTVITGKAFISPISGVRPKKPPLGEPKSKVKSTERRASRRRKVRDHHVAVKRAVKSIERKRSQNWISQPPV